jgi:hypothetical protein
MRGIWGYVKFYREPVIAILIVLLLVGLVSTVRTHNSGNDNNQSSNSSDLKLQAAEKLPDRDRLDALWYYQTTERNKALVDQSVGLAQKLFDRMMSGKIPYKISGPNGNDDKAPVNGPAVIYADTGDKPYFSLTVNMKKGKPTLVTDHAFLTYRGGQPTISWRFDVSVDYGQYTFIKNGNESYRVEYPSTNTIMQDSTLLDFDKVAGVTYCPSKYAVGVTSVSCQYVDTATIKEIDRNMMFVVDNSLTPFLVDR